MKSSTLLLIMPCLCTGCTNLALERHTINQVATITDARFQQVLDNLAATAANPAILPGYAPIGEGIAQVQDTLIFDAKTVWARAMFKGFSSETLSLTGIRNPYPQWTVDPAAEPPQLAALHYACLSALLGPPPPESPAAQVLHRFQVDDALRDLPPCWLRHGKWTDIPHEALYRAHCGDTWVWVTAEGMEGLSAFTLVIQDIATVSVPSLDKQPGAGTVKIKFGADQNAPTVEAKAKSVVPGTSNGPDDLTPSRIVIVTPPGDLDADPVSLRILKNFMAERARGDYSPSQVPAPFFRPYSTINPHQNIQSIR